MKSNKIGTLSLNINTDDFNYGALLHSWAFQKYLIKNKLCKETEIIDYVTPKLEDYNRKYPIKWAIKNKRIKSIIKNIIIYPSYKSRYAKFEKFIKENMHISSKHYTQEMLNKEHLDYDTIVCESDVIWNANFFGGEFDKTFFMNLDSMKNVKKIAYAPSMADGELDDKQKLRFKELLNEIDYISCRETYAKQIIEKYTEKKIEHVLDPVMLLDKEDYEGITGDRLLANKYLLLYLPVDNNKKLREAAKKYAESKKLKVLEITTKCLKSINHKTITNAGIEEFLSAIKYADVVFTNSFHAICFSLIFEREFYGFSRKSSGKVRDICEIMNLSERFFKDDNFIELNNIDYNDTNKIINKMKEKSKLWINKALNE